MCNIAYMPAGIEAPEAEIQNAATWNQDGHGWAIAAEHGVMLTGRYLDADQAIATFVATRKAFPNAPALFHSRLATHGTVSTDNVHPFEVGRYAAVAHNGILPSKFHPVKGKNDHMSDTAIMARYWLAGRAQTSGVWTRKERQRIGRIIGKGNKLVILSVSPFLPEPKGYLVNGGQGQWDSITGAWFSNGDYKYAWTPQTSKFGRGGWLWDGDDYGVGEHMGTAWTKAKDVDRCPNCGHSEQLDIHSGVCLYCDFCLDCLFELRNCMCHYPGESIVDGHDIDQCEETHCAKCSASAFEQANAAINAEIEVQVSELGGES